MKRYSFGETPSEGILHGENSEDTFRLYLGYIQAMVKLCETLLA